MRRVAAGLSVLSAICVVAVAIGAAASAAATEVPHSVERVTIYLHSPTQPHRRELIISVYPLEGEATASTVENGPGRSGSGVNYVVAIPKAPFDGSLDLDLPGLGKVVGTVAPTKSLSPAGLARFCAESTYHSELATFEGHLAFRGAGGYDRWRATSAEAEVVPTCGEGAPPSHALHRPLPEPGVSGDFITFFAKAKTDRRLVEFVVVGHRGSRAEGQLIAVDSETLPGKVVTQRWVERRPVPFERTVSFAQETSHPSSITFTPPAPFYGRATYHRSTDKLTGSLGVHFPGLDLRLAHPPATVTFEDEERGTGA